MLFTIRESTRAMLLIVLNFVGYWLVILFIGTHLSKPASSVYTLCRYKLVEHKNLYGYFLALIHVRILIILVCGACTSSDSA